MAGHTLAVSLFSVMPLFVWAVSGSFKYRIRNTILGNRILYDVIWPMVALLV